MGVTEKAREGPRWYPTSFGIGGEKSDLLADHSQSGLSSGLASRAG
jgi:hypothetical protein